MDGADIIKRFEGCRLAAYPDPATGGAPITIGWGSTRDKDGRPFALGMSVTQAQADALLVRDFNDVKAGIMKDGNMAALPPACVDAVASVCYNIKGGFAAFRRSKCYAGIVAKNTAQVYHEWDWGVTQSGVQVGLGKRRAFELYCFFDGLSNAKMAGGWK